MRKLLFVLLLLTAAMAVEIDAETGCEKYSDHLICPQTSDVAVNIDYVSDMECYTILNEFGTIEPLGCYGKAGVINDIEYESCFMYVPFNEKDVIMEGIDYEYQCAIEKITAGTQILVMGSEEQYSDCNLVEEEEFGSYTLCNTEGQKYSTTGSLAYTEDGYTLLLYTQDGDTFKGADLMSPLLFLIVLVLLIYAAYIWSERKK